MKHSFPGGRKFTNEEIDNFLTFLVEGAMLKGIAVDQFKETSNIYRIITQLKDERDEATKSS